MKIFAKIVAFSCLLFLQENSPSYDVTSVRLDLDTSQYLIYQ